MPATIPFGFYQGTRSEYLATYALSRLSIVTPVPREGDSGIDLIGHLARREGSKLVVGAPFSVQVKTQGAPLNYPSSPGERCNDEVKWLLGQSMPFLPVIVDREANRLKVYSTWSMPKLLYERGYDFTQIRLIPGEEGDGVEEPLWTTKTGVGEVFLGAPILDIHIDDLEDNNHADKLAAVLGDWVHLDQQNQANKLADICYVVGHRAPVPNERPAGDPHRYIAFGSAALPSFRKRLAEVLSVTGHALEHVGDGAKAGALVGALEYCEEDLDMIGRALLARLRPPESS